MQWFVWQTNWYLNHISLIIFTSSGLLTPETVSLRERVELEQMIHTGFVTGLTDPLTRTEPKEWFVHESESPLYFFILFEWKKTQILACSSQKAFIWHHFWYFYRAFFVIYELNSTSPNSFSWHWKEYSGYFSKKLFLHVFHTRKKVIEARSNFHFWENYFFKILQ